MKFLSQPHVRQQKILAELLEEYNRLAVVLDEQPLVEPTFEQLADRHHHHAAQAGRGMPHLVRTGDRPSTTPYLPITIYLNNLRSAHNVGSIVRTTEAFRLGSLHLQGTTPPLDHPQTRKAAMGAQVPTTHNLPRPFIALETTETATPLHDFCPPPTFTLLIGNEEYGVSSDLLDQADQVVEIPLVGTKNSLNVANAYAIAAAHIAHHLRTTH